MGTPALEERSWSESDKQEILSLGRAFGITFKEYTDLTSQKMEEVLIKARSSLSEGKNHGLLVFIMTHGTNDDMLYGSDQKLISVKQLAEIFESNKCPLLKDKPKIFVIHACRGSDVDPVPATPHPQNDQQPTDREAHREGPPPDSSTYVCILFNTSLYCRALCF